MALKLGAAIKLCRVQKSLTQAELAARARLSESYVSLLEKNKRDPTFSALEAIANALDIPISLLVFFAADSSEFDFLGQDVKEKLSTAVINLLKSTANEPQRSLL
jgi:transcriptional regulator with XRE-family HTH domain